MNKNNFLLTAVFFLATISSAFAQTAKVSSKELQPLVGNWKGSLTYLDYSSGKPYTMPADIDIRQEKKSNLLFLSNLYPDEPKANSMDTLTISHNGQMINNATVRLNRKLKNGNREIVTEIAGFDGNDNKQATIRTTYTFGKGIFTNIKEVQFADQDVWIKRHEYSYTRK